MMRLLALGELWGQYEIPPNQNTFIEEGAYG
jgi:hypothetical protein